ncbi:HlyD family secretion protein [Labrys monachus]|uniref:Membrane fusion protein (Multidrug efflux system) n=1 Tax=Labrys monachus TaxID=217067 RepID=A0ABU0FA57_9HYPH|nr:HlyD family secretion protein [Labrys monachus]MDQ0391475.1 membrane fusion protein (multidrug efflux system) [Labrys monachus]
MKASAGGAEAGKPRRNWIRRHPFLSVGIAIVAALALVAVLLWWLQARHFESTDDAFIDARAFSVAPEVTGYLVDVPIEDNEHVVAGAVLVRIDDRDYKAALVQAQAQVQAAKANIANIDAQIVGQQTQIERAQAQVKQAEAAVQFAREEADRYKKLQQSATGSVQQAQQTSSQLLQQEANLASAQAQVDAAKQQSVALAAQRTSAVASLAQASAQADKAQLDLSRTTIVAAQSGHLAHVSAAKGQYAQPGQSLMMLVPDAIWVTANFKETQITDMRPGQPVALSIDAYPDVDFRGHVDSIQSGSGTAFSLLPAENATGNYVKVVQRVPVKIVLDNIPKDIVLGPGMSVVPSVTVR